MSLLNALNLGVIKFSSKEASRFTLNGILVTPNETVATDGHRLTMVTTPTVKGGGVASFPELPGFTIDGNWKPFVMPTDVAADLLKKIPKKSKIPILMHAAIGARSANGERIQVATTDLSTNTILDVRPVAGNFPDWQRVMPSGEIKGAISINARYLADIGSFIASHGERLPTCTILYRGHDRPLEIVAKISDTNQQIRSVIMGVKMDEADIPVAERKGKKDATVKAIAAPAVLAGPATEPIPVVNVRELSYEILADLFSEIPDKAQQDRLLMDPTLSDIITRRINAKLYPATEEPEPAEQEAVDMEVVESVQ